MLVCRPETNLTLDMICIFIPYYVYPFTRLSLNKVSCTRSTKPGVSLHLSYVLYNTDIMTALTEHIVPEDLVGDYQALSREIYRNRGVHR